MVSSFFWSKVSDKAREKRRTGKKERERLEKIKKTKRRGNEVDQERERERDEGDVIGALGERDTFLPFF